MLIDAHCHLDDYGSELDLALAAVRMNRILSLSNSMDFFSYHRISAIAEDCPYVIPGFGIHPWNAPHFRKNLDRLDKFLPDAPFLGEFGLDQHFIDDASTYPLQEEVFDYFLGAAKKYDKIVNVHTKGAEGKVLDMMDRHEIKKAVIHWYSGPDDIFHEMVSRGYYFTVGVSVLSAHTIQTVAQDTPEDRLLTETDNPGACLWMRNEVGMPMLILDVVEKIAEVWSVDTDRVIEMVENNMRRLFSCDEKLSRTFDQLS